MPEHAWFVTVTQWQQRLFVPGRFELFRLTFAGKGPFRRLFAESIEVRFRFKPRRKVIQGSLRR
jgi:hypothetical protein